MFVPDGGDQRFDFDPDRGYEIDRVRVDGDSERVRSSYTFEEVTENHTIRVTFTETDEGGDDGDDDDDDGGITYRPSPPRPARAAPSAGRPGAGGL